METRREDGRRDAEDHVQGSRTELDQPSRRDETSRNGEPNNYTTDATAQLSYEDAFPWPFIPKWPVSRSERIHELEQMAPFFESHAMKDNITAAINWHATFPPNDMVPSDIVIFQNGKEIEESELRLENGEIWEEGCVQDLMTGHGAQSTAAFRGP